MGVAQADPIVAASPWFVIRQSAVSYKERLSILLTSKLSGKPIFVSTTGNVVAACGQAAVSVVIMP